MRKSVKRRWRFEICRKRLEKSCGQSEKGLSLCFFELNSIGYEGERSGLKHWTDMPQGSRDESCGDSGSKTSQCEVLQSCEPEFNYKKLINPHKKCTHNSICECIFYIVLIEKVQIWTYPYLDFLDLIQISNEKRKLSYMIITIYDNCRINLIPCKQRFDPHSRYEWY